MKYIRNVKEERWLQARSHSWASSLAQVLLVEICGRKNSTFLLQQSLFFRLYFVYPTHVHSTFAHKTFPAQLKTISVRYCYAVVHICYPFKREENLPINTGYIYIFFFLRETHSFEFVHDLNMQDYKQMSCLFILRRHLIVYHTVEWTLTFRFLPMYPLSRMPQESALGFLLFLIHINDFPSNVESTIKLCAVGCALHRKNESPSDRVAQSDLNKITEWCATCEIQNNSSKCSLLTVENKQITPDIEY